MAVRIPKPIAEQWGVHEGSAIELVPRGDRVAMHKTTYNLADMLAEITEDNVHPESDTGPPQGNEEW